jgi:hypothetical protein
MKSRNEAPVADWLGKSWSTNGCFVAKLGGDRQERPAREFAAKRGLIFKPGPGPGPGIHHCCFERVVAEQIDRMATRLGLLCWSKDPSRKPSAWVRPGNDAKLRQRR